MMTIDLSILKKLAQANSAYELEECIISNFQEIYDFLNNQKTKDLRAFQDEIQKYFFKSHKFILALDSEKPLNLRFVSLLAEACSKLSLLNEFKKLYQFLQRSQTNIDKVLVATKEYCSVEKLSDFFENYPKILDTLNEALEEETKEVLTAKFLDFYLYIIYQYADTSLNHTKIKALISNIKSYYNSKKYYFLDENIVNKIVNEKFDDYLNLVNIFDNYLEQKRIICSNKNVFLEDDTKYSQILRSLPNLKIDDLQKIAKEYIENNILDEQNLYNQLERGVKILQNQDQLFKYMKSYYYMHKQKLYQAYEILVSNLQEKNLNIIDWGCGQAFASTLFVDFVKENEIQISNLKLIEPSVVALKRGLLHIDVFKTNDIEIEPINKDLDCINEQDLSFKNENATLHLFSNILDVTSFTLDESFLHKISNNLSKTSYFVCVSPNINNSRNSRLDIFYKYFNDNFNTTLLSKRDSCIEKYSRYEIIFKVEK